MMELPGIKGGPTHRFIQVTVMSALAKWVAEWEIVLADCLFCDVSEMF